MAALTQVAAISALISGPGPSRRESGKKWDRTSSEERKAKRAQRKAERQRRRKNRRKS